MYKDQNQQHQYQQQQQQKVKAWESTVRRSQQQHQPGNRRRFFSPMSVAPADDDSFTTTTTAAATATTTSCSSDGDDDDPSSSPVAGAEDHDAAAAGGGREQGEGGAGRGERLRRAERLLANGDFYTGQWSGGVPHGVGKYLWADGCMYEGDWRHGKTTGQGKFSWPSGATYEGEFKAGFMDGTGTYTGASGDTYRGAWSMNLKHGHGTKSYANGDFYEGEWRSGLQDGHGRYVWRNGTEYVGQWRAGLIHGRGSIVWANGNQYDGGWDDGWPRGNGNFRWADGSLYVGTWTKESAGIEQKGVYYPSPAATSPTVRDPQDAFAAGLKECRVSPGEAVSILPSQKPLNWSGAELHKPSKVPDRRRASADHAGANGVPPRRPNGRVHTVIGTNDNVGEEKGFDRICIWEADGDITCDIVDRNSVAASASSRERQGSERRITGRLRSDERDARSSAASTPRAGRWPPSTPAKKQGMTISKGHKNYELMLNLQLGIRHAVGKQGPTNFDLKASAFDPREKVWTRFPPEGSKHTPPHQSCDFRWKDYCPLVFRTLRRLFKVDPAEYMMSLCGNDALRELSSPGKSGSFFYLTQDDRYMIKTMKKAEVKVLLRMLPAYYKHVSAFEDTLVTKFYGLHCVKLTGASQKKVRFVIMGNLFCSEFAIHRRFDLKGSSLGRVTSKPDSEIDQYTTLKDLDLNFIFRLQKTWFQEFQRQINKDSEFLEQEKIMDYSLLVGVHFKSPRDTQLMEGKADVERIKDARPRLSRVDVDQFLCNPNRCTTIRLGINMPAKAELTVRRSDSDSSQLIGEPTGEFYEVVLFFGIIDILQAYDISKRVEHVYKSFQHDPTSISAVDPKQYARRFRDFIHRAFTEDT